MWDIIVIIGSAVGIILLWIMLYDSTRFVVVRHSIRDSRIRKPYRAVVLADLHSKKFGKNNCVLIEAIREQQPDGIFVAGDMITARKRISMEPAISLLRELAAQYPIYYGNGNHEHRIKLSPKECGSMAREYDKALKEMGVRLLVNEHVILAEHNITIYGAEIDRFYYKRFRIPPMADNYLKGLLGEAQRDRYLVLLAHNPDYFPRYAQWGADLALAGHIHGGIIRIPHGRGLLSPAVRLFPKYDGGLFREGEGTMLLSRGVGNHGIPGRLFNPGEVLVVDFLPEND